MKKLLVIILALSLLIGVPAIASDTSTAKNYGIITVSNNSTANSRVATVFTANTTAWIANEIMNSSANNTAIISASGVDLAYMPGYDGSPWAFFVPYIGANTYLNDILYTGGSSNMSGKIRYFPDSSGMTVPDDASLEITDNGSIEASGYFDTTATANRSIFHKPFAITANVSATVSGNITASILDTLIELNGNTPASVDDPDTAWNNDGNTIDGNVATSAAPTVAIGAGAWSSYLVFNLSSSDWSDSISIYASATAGHVDTCDIDAYYDGAWQNVFEGNHNNNAWFTASFSAQEIGQYRVRFYNNDGNARSVGFYETSCSSENPVASVTATGVSSGEISTQLTMDSPFLSLNPDGTATPPVATNLVVNTPLWQSECSSSPFTTIDSNALTATVSGATWTLNEGYGFDGVNDDISIPDDASIQNIFDGGGTIEFVTNPDSDGENNAGRLIDKGWTFYNHSESGGQVKLQLRCPFSGTEGRWATTSLAQDIGVFSHIVLTYDNSNVANNPTLYVNGSPVALTESQAPVGTRTTDAGNVLYIGNRSDGATTFDGGIGEVRLYDVELTADEVLQNYNATKSKYTSGDIYVYSTLSSVPDNSNDWVFGSDATIYIEEASIDVAGVEKGRWQWEYATTFTDLSGNGNDATPTFRAVSSDADVSASLSSFFPVSEAKAPAYTLSDAPDFFTSTPGISGNFTSGGLSPTYPGHEIITQIAAKGGVPDQLPQTIFSTFVLIVLSFAFSYMNKAGGVNSLFLKMCVITSIMCVFVAIGIYDAWMVYFFVLMGISTCWLSRQREAY